MFTMTAPKTDLGAGFSLDTLKQAAGAATGGGSLSTVTQSLVPPETLRKALRSSDAYTQNRDRMALVLEKGIGAYDTYVSIRPALFYGSLVAAAASAYMLYRRRKIGAEAVTLYTASMLVSLAVAWFTRPGLTATAPTPAGALTADAQAQANVLASLDKMVAARRAQDPAFADKVFQRIVQMPGIREQMQANPLVKAAVL